MNTLKSSLSVFLMVAFCLVCDGSLSAQAKRTSRRATVYVPAYSSIFHGDLKWEFNLTVVLSIHNTDLKNKMILDVIDYYDSSGKIIRSYIKGGQIVLNPLETYTLGIKETDRSGGVGANFIVKWRSASGISQPVIETIMIGTRAQQGISFSSRGVVIEE